MAAYFVLELEITNRDTSSFKFYREAATTIVEQYGGRFLARGGSTELIEAGPEMKPTNVIVEFADKAAFRYFYHSPEYQEILPGGLANCNGRAFVVEGVT